ncbi:MAG: sortase [Bacilli bacterium]|nr:sortase [Bacilli bacterium]
MLVSYLASVSILGFFFLRGNLGKDDIIKSLDINNDNIWFEIYIPRINLRKFVYTMDSDLNNVDYNVEILDSSNLERKVIFLASHSGGGKASYFDNLVYLEKGDIIRLKGIDFRYVFVVEEEFYIQKNGYFDNFFENEENVLYMITCSLKYIDKQLIVKARLISKC